MNNKLQLQQMYYQHQLRRRQLLENYRVILQAKISRITERIAAGGDPANEPDYRDDYLYLVGLFGEEVFETEDGLHKVEVEK